jgi:hypothetical protein
VEVVVEVVVVVARARVLVGLRVKLSEVQLSLCSRRVGICSLSHDEGALSWLSLAGFQRGSGDGIQQRHTKLSEQSLKFQFQKELGGRLV